MPGLPKFRRNSPVLKQIYVLIALAIVFLWGCSGSEKATKISESAITQKEFLARYEKTFNPADYDVDVTVIKAEEQKRFAALEDHSVLTPVVAETISGFRVQVFLTQEIDEANQIKDTVAAKVPDEWVYVVYDAPYYKVRVGNFADRSAANIMVRKLSQGGYKDAWVVPDKVYKNPPPKLPEILIEPEKPLDQHR